MPNDTGGPAALRRLIEDLRDSDAPWSKTQATVYADDIAKLRELAAQWEAERESFHSDFRAKYDIETKKLYTELEQERAASAEAEKRLHDCTSLAEVERNAQRAIWKELRDLFDCKPNESLVGVCNQTVSRLEQARALLANVYDDSPCRLDHHGYCQEHIGSWSGECWMRRVEKFLAELGGAR